MEVFMSKHNIDLLMTTADRNSYKPDYSQYYYINNRGEAYPVVEQVANQAVKEEVEVKGNRTYTKRAKSTEEQQPVLETVNAFEARNENDSKNMAKILEV